MPFPPARAERRRVTSPARGHHVQPHPEQSQLRRARHRPSGRYPGRDEAKIQPVEHHAALPWREIGAFIATLRTQPGLAAQALQLTVLTVSRSSEVLCAKWDEIDMEKGV